MDNLYEMVYGKSNGHVINASRTPLQEGIAACAWRAGGLRLVFTARRYALRGLNYRNSIRPSVTLVDCVHMVRHTIMISSP